MAVASLRDDALKTSLTGVLIHLGAIDLEALAKLDLSLGNDFLEQGLALGQRQLPEVITVEVKQIERDHHNLFGPPLEFVQQHREVRGAVRCRDHHLAIDDRRSGVDVPRVGCDLSETIGPVIAAPGEYLDDRVFQMDLDAVTVEFDFMDPPFTVSTEVANAGSMKPGNGALTPGLRAAAIGHARRIGSGNCTSWYRPSYRLTKS